MAQTPGAVPGQAAQAASMPRPRENEAGGPESLLAILKRASGPDDKDKRAPKLASVHPMPGPAPEQVRKAASPPDRRANDPIDEAGHALIALLQSAAEVSNQEYDRASILAGRLAGEVRATESRIRELEAEVSHYRERAARAEDWLAQI